jgi:hypothetical protein
MRDDSKRWLPPRSQDSKVEAPDLIINEISMSRLIMVSGPDALRQTELALAEWPAVVTETSYALSLRRDRVLEVEGPARPDGWDTAKNIAVSDVTDGFANFELSGQNAMNILRRGAEVDLGTPSRSVARLMFGFGVFLYRHGSDTRFRLHVPSAHRDAMWHALEDTAAHLS